MAMPAGFLEVSTAPDTSTPAADKKGPHAGMGVPEGLGDRLGEALDDVVTLALRLPLSVDVRVRLGENEGSAGPTKMDVALTTAPV